MRQEVLKDGNTEIERKTKTEIQRHRVAQRVTDRKVREL